MVVYNNLHITHEPEKKWIAEREKYQQLSARNEMDPERKKYQAEPEKKWFAKRQWNWKSSEPGCLVKRVRYREVKYTLPIKSPKGMS